MLNSHRHFMFRLSTSVIRRTGRSAIGVSLVAILATLGRRRLAERTRLSKAGNTPRHGDRDFANGKLAEAIIEYKTSVASDAAVGAVHAKLAEAYLKTNDGTNAAREYIRAADLLPEDLTVQLKAGTLLLLGKRPDDAKLRAESVLAREPRNVEAQILLANAQAGLRDLDGAVAQIEEALRIDPNRSGIYSSLGAIELNRGKRDAAEKAFKKAVELQQNAVEPHIALANFYWLTDQRDLAEASLTRALTIDPRSALANRLLANFYIATNRREKAERPLRVVFDVTQTSASAFALAEYYVAVNRDNSAREVLGPLTKDPRSAPFADVRLATLDHKEGRKDEAYHRLTGVLAQNAGNLEALLIKTSLLMSDKQVGPGSGCRDNRRRSAPRFRCRILRAGPCPGGSSPAGRRDRGVSGGAAPQSSRNRSEGRAQSAASGSGSRRVVGGLCRGSSGQ